MKGRILASVSVASLVASSLAHAQQATAPAANADNSQTLEEVVVTAERRSTDLQNAALAASVLAGNELQERGIHTVDDLQFSVPSVTLQNFGQGNYFNIRGIGKSDNSSAIGVGVITYRDGVATFPGYFQEEPYYDIASVEVLRGPQGTFLGGNAIGGAVFITEANPSLDGMHGNAELQYGNYNDALVRAAINLPLSDTLALRVAVNDERRDSFWEVSGPYTGSPGRYRDSSARASLLWQPTEALQVLLKEDYNYIDLGGYPADPATATNDPFHITSNAAQYAVDKYSRTVLDVNYTLDSGIKLRSVTGYQSGWTTYRADLDGTAFLPFTFTDHVKEDILSEEINVLSPDKGFFTWLAGLYYQKDNVVFPPAGYDIGEPPGVFDFVFNGINPKQTKAVFGQVSFNFEGGLQIQAGARFTDASSTNDATFAVPELAVSYPQYQTERDNRLTGKLAANYTLNDANFLYAFVATGHKGGGVNTPLAPGPLPPTFGPEDVIDYELGWKATALAGHLKTQLGVFYDTYKNFQVSIPEPNSVSTSLILNIPSDTDIYGLEAEAQAVFGGLSFNVGGSFLHSRLGTFFAADPRLPVTAASCALTSGPVGGGCVDLTGLQETYAPTFTFNLGVQYLFTLPRGTLTPRIDFGHIGPQWGTLFEDRALGDQLAARNLLNAELPYALNSWRFSAYGTNLNDQHYISAVASNLRFAGAPRQYGLRLSKDF